MNNTITPKNRIKVITIAGFVSLLTIISAISVFLFIQHNQRIPPLDEVRNRLNKEQEIVNQLRAEDEKPSECQRILFYPEQDSVVRKVLDFSAIRQDSIFSDVRRNFSEKGFGKIGKNYIHEMKINDPDYQSIIKIRMHFTDGLKFIDGVYNLAKIINIEIVSKDCKVIQVPVNPDGTFNFEEALQKI